MPVIPTPRSNADGGASCRGYIANISNGSTPLIEMLQYSSGSLVDYNVTLLFKSHGCEDNYLRIEDDCLEDAVIPMDDAKSMDKLIDIGNKLIDREVYRTDWETRRYQPVYGAGTNAEALTNLAWELSDERKRRITAAAAAAARQKGSSSAAHSQPEEMES